MQSTLGKRSGREEKMEEKRMGCGKGMDRASGKSKDH
jgi:hypothetical protein